MMTRLAPELLLGAASILAIAKEGSATKAAKALSTTPATILRRLEAAEEALGVVLFERLPSGLVGTPALALALPWLERCAESLEGLVRALAQTEVDLEGTTRLAAPPVLESVFLLPILESLKRKYPALTIELSAGNALVDLGQQEADLALRTIFPERGDLIAKKLASYDLVIACAPKLLEQGLTLNELPWLSWDRSMEHSVAARWLTTRLPDAQVVLRSSSLGTLLAAARRGQGALLVAAPLLERTPGLCVVACDEPLPQEQLWLVTHRALRHIPRVAVVWDEICAWFERAAQGDGRLGALDLGDQEA